MTPKPITPSRGDRVLGLAIIIYDDWLSDASGKKATETILKLLADQREKDAKIFEEMYGLTNQEKIAAAIRRGGA